jgi:Fur family ferric uptake transcriptional regulator
MTRQRTAVARALQSAEGFQSAQALHDAMRHAGDSVGLTTVYRHLQALVDAGGVDVLRTDDGEAVYRQCVAEDHHHHLVCRVCGTTVEVTGPVVEKWAAQIGQAHGFTDVSHTVEVFGTCRGCR